MDILGLVDLPIWLIGIIVFVGSMCIYTRYKQTYFTRNGYIQKDTLFLLGDFLEIISKGFGYIDESVVSKHGKVFGSYLGNLPTLVINDAEMIKTIFVKEFSNFSDKSTMIQIADEFKSMVSVAEGNHWKYLRSVLSPTFSSGKMRQMQPLLKRCLEQFHEIVEEKQTEGQDFDLTPILRGYTMDVICSTGFGMDVNSQRDPDNLFIKYSKEFLEFKGQSSMAFLAAIFFPDFHLLHRIIGPTRLMSKICWDFFIEATTSAFEERQRTESQHKDLIQLMINAHKDKDVEIKEGSEALSLEDLKKRGLTNEEILMNSLIFMVAGFDTTATALSWLVYDISVHPDVQNKLRQEIDSEIGQNEPTYDTVFKMPYLEMVVNETLRMHPPATTINRVCANDTEVCGIKIPKGMVLSFYPRALHFLEEYWEKPHKYIPERFAPENRDNINEYAYIPFALGPRNCIGMRLALLEVKMTIVSILQKYMIHKSDKLKVPMPSSDFGLCKPAEPVFVRLEKRNVS